MVTGYSTVSSVVLWLMLGYVYFFSFYLIRMVVFFNGYHTLDCCTLLSGKFFFPCSFCCCDVFRCFLCCFSFLVVGLVLQRGCVYLLLGVDTVFVHRVVITVRAISY